MNSMKIWVDADACPAAIKNLLFRAAKRLRISLIFVANRPLRIPSSEYITSIVVPGGFDVADDTIVERISEGDLVITADIPFAANVIAKGAEVLDHRGALYTKENIGERLSIRNFLADLRSAGVKTGGPSSFGQRDRQAFANQLDRYLVKRVGSSPAG